MAKRDPTIALPEPRETYAFERSCGMTPAEACRRAGGKVENGTATKWERSPRVQSRIRHLRTLGQTEEMLAAKRARLEERLQLAAFGNLFDFANVDASTGDDPQIDWARLAESPYGVIVSSFKFDKDTGRLVDFDRDNALQAIAQLRDMNGFKAPEAHRHDIGDVLGQILRDIDGRTRGLPAGA